MGFSKEEEKIYLTNETEILFQPITLFYTFSLLPPKIKEE